MTIAALIALIAACGGQDGSVEWATRSQSVPGKYSAKATLPILTSGTALAKLFNRDMRRLSDSLVADFVADHQPGQSLVAKANLSVATPTFVSALLSVERSDRPLELYPVSVFLNGAQPVRCVWGNLVKPGTDADLFAKTLLLPVLNRQRSLAGLHELSEFPPGHLDDFVLTKSNLSWIVPAGVAGVAAEQVKVSLETLRPWLDPDGALRHLFERTAGVSVPVAIVVTWVAREGLPPDSVVRVSLLRNRDDLVPLGARSFPAQDPPMELKFSIEGVRADLDERLFLDVRVLSNGQTLYRNRTPERIPVVGWQTVHEIKLDRDR